MIWEATGSTNGEWRYVDIRVPDEYLNTDDFWLAFYFYSDMSIYFEGAYLDYIQVKTYDIGLLDYNLNTNITDPGEAFEISYYIDNSSPYNIEVGLGAALRDPNGNIIYDHENDVVVTVPANSTVWAERLFKMPSDAASGSYDLQLTLWSGDPWNSRLWHDSGWISNAIELESNEYFYDVTINPLDSDGDGYNDGLEIEMDVDTTDGTLMVTVAGYLVDSNNNVFIINDEENCRYIIDNGEIKLFLPMLTTELEQESFPDLSNFAVINELELDSTQIKKLQNLMKRELKVHVESTLLCLHHLRIS